MKKFLIAVLTLIYSLNATGQEIPLSDIVNISLPVGLEKINKEQLATINQPSTNINRLRIPVINLNGKGHFYRANGMLIKLNALRAPTAKDYLKDTQKVLYEMSNLLGSLPPNYSSQIRLFNDFEALIIYKDESENVGSYTFFCINSSHSSGFNGIMEFNISQKNKATKVVEDILNNLSFK